MLVGISCCFSFLLHKDGFFLDLDVGWNVFPPRPTAESYGVHRPGLADEGWWFGANLGDPGLLGMFAGLSIYVSFLLSKDLFGLQEAFSLKQAKE